MPRINPLMPAAEMATRTKMAMDIACALIVSGQHRSCGGSTLTDISEALAKQTVCITDALINKLNAEKKP